jgi:glycosyltransferase involved in cell wall biosynthesis
MPARPWLSLLVPAYAYPEGLGRILDSLVGLEVAGVECLVHDDSRDDSTERLVREHRAFREGAVQYRRNRPALGAVRNWNSLLAAAQGEYVVLMHHDEFPDSPGFFAQVRGELQRLSSPDIMILGCLVPSVAGRWRRHMPPLVQRLLLNMAPGHLLRHNTIGPTAALVIRRERVQAFDERLQWLVDVEWAHRLITAPASRWVLANARVLSSPKPGGSITASLAGRTAQLAREESMIVQERLGRIPAVRLQAPDAAWERGLDVLERSVWLGARAAIRVAGLLVQQPGRRAP